jgi:diguanylate cyclase (GGDEF)-like protein
MAKSFADDDLHSYLLVMSIADSFYWVQINFIVRSAIETFDFELDRDRSRVTISLGVACYAPPETADSLLSRTDGALYEAKERGRNCVVSV